MRCRELDIFKILEFFEKLFGNCLDFLEFFEGIFLVFFWWNSLGGIFRENFFGRNSLGGSFFLGILLKEFFGRNALFTLLKSELFEYERDLFVCQDFVSMEGRKKEEF